jgi:hypothetical protein
MQPTRLPPGGRLRARACAAAAVLLVALATPAPARAQQDLDTPFDSPRYLVHHSGRGTMDGHTTLDYLSLEREAPQGPTMQTPGGDGTEFTDEVELVGGPFATPRDVCNALQGRSLSAGFSCPAPQAEATSTTAAPEESTPVADGVGAGDGTSAAGVPEAPALGASDGDVPAAQPRARAAKSFSEWWSGLSGLAQFGVVALGLIILKALFGSAAPLLRLRGKMSTFGGPSDRGVGPDEGLALVNENEMAEISDYFLAEQPPGTTGLARRLNPAKPYIACRWDYAATPRDTLRKGVVKVINVRTGKFAFAKPVDWGPNVKTGRIADLSPGLAQVLDLTTDDEVEVVLER